LDAGGQVAAAPNTTRDDDGEDHGCHDDGDRGVDEGLQDFLQGLGLGAYQALFEQHCITLESVFSLDNTALKAMQLPSEARGKLLALTAPCASRATATCAHGEAVHLTAVASVVASGASQAAHGASPPLLQLRQEMWLPQMQPS